MRLRRHTMPVREKIAQVAHVDTELCTGCGKCEQECPAQAITVTTERKAVVDQRTCRGCGACAQVCPKGAIRMVIAA